MHVQVQWIRRRCHNCSKVQKLCHMSSKKIPFNPFKSPNNRSQHNCVVDAQGEPTNSHQCTMKDGWMDDEFDQWMKTQIASNTTTLIQASSDH